MKYRLSEKHFSYGEAGLVINKDQYAGVTFHDKAIFEKITDEDNYADIYIVLNNEEFEYIVFDQRELLVILMKYLEPGNRKFINRMEVVIPSNCINEMAITQAMIEIAILYPFIGFGGTSGSEYIFRVTNKG